VAENVVDMIDLRSDTVTLPSPEMRVVIAQAAVGDDVYGEDPSVNALEARAASVTGKDAAMYVPSGTMGNLCAHLAHTAPGQEVICSGAEPHLCRRSRWRRSAWRPLHADVAARAGRAGPGGGGGGDPSP